MYSGAFCFRLHWSTASVAHMHALHIALASDCLPLILDVCLLCRRRRPMTA